jgi:crossover junction endodeoxyribonuclease RuvC
LGALSLTQGMMTSTIRLLGLDPGLRCTGWGIIEKSGHHLRHLGHGVIVSNARNSLPQRLCELHDKLAQVIENWQPDSAAVEQTFVSRDGAATLKLGQARAIALLVPARAGLPVSEYAPNAVKKAVVGVGHADKAQIRAMVHRLLPRCHIAQDDAADALAVAICHAHAMPAPPLVKALKVASLS